MSEDDPDAVARQRLKVIQLARQLGNVSEACRRSRISRTRFYEWKRRYEADGLAGLRDRRKHDVTIRGVTPDRMHQRILRVSLAHPSWGCDRVASFLNEEGLLLSGVTIQKVRNRYGLGRREDRRRTLQECKRRFRCRLTGEQLDFVHARAGRRLRDRTGIGLFRFRGSFEEAIEAYRHASERIFGPHPLVCPFSSILKKHALALLDVARLLSMNGKGAHMGVRL